MYFQIKIAETFSLSLLMCNILKGRNGLQLIQIDIHSVLVTIESVFTSLTFSLPLWIIFLSTLPPFRLLGDIIKLKLYDKFSHFCSPLMFILCWIYLATSYFLKVKIFNERTSLYLYMFFLDFDLLKEHSLISSITRFRWNPAISFNIPKTFTCVEVHCIFTCILKRKLNLRVKTIHY